MQAIFKNATVERLEDELRTGNSLKDYFEGKWRTAESEVLRDSTIECTGPKPVLVTGNRNISVEDSENAIKLHKYLPTLTEVQASDKRLWAYLTHVDFKDYCLHRWEYGMDWEELLSSKKREDEKAAAIRHFQSHWFTGSSARNLRRNALARLWWPAHLTYAPWKRAGNSVIPELEDPYAYTRLLFTSQDIYLQILERAPFWHPVMLIAMLEFIRRNPQLKGAELREMVREIVKNINLLSGSRKLTFMPFQEIVELIQSISRDFAKKTSGQ
jgi:uncharacterized protein DUF6339